MQVRDRITELRRVPASSLRPNARNWRAHPVEQQDALRGLLAEVGFADALIARELPDGSLELIDGHLRAEIAPDCIVPVLVLDVNEAEADLLLASLDTVSALAETLPLKLDHLLARLDFKIPAIGTMLDKYAASAEGTAERSKPIRTGEKAIEELFHVIVICDSEAEQREAFERLRAEGYACRLRTL